MKYKAIIFLFFVACPQIYGQLNPYDYDPDEFHMMDESQSFAGEELFAVPLRDGINLFDLMSRYNFSAVRSRTRGYNFRTDRNFISNIEISPLLTSYEDYSLLSNLRLSRLRNQNFRGITDSGLAGLGRKETYSIKTSSMPDAKRVVIGMSNRKSRYRAQFAGVESGDKWAFGLAGNVRAGEDSEIKGVFNSEANLLISGEYNISEGHTLNALFSGGISQSGARSYTTQRAYDMIGDKFYNPSWGYYDGDVRNSKVYEKSQPLFILSYEGEVSDNTVLTASAAYKFGTNSYSTLSWSNVGVPYPDYYLFLEEPTMQEGWLYGDPDITQINWSNMYEKNLALSEAGYWQEERVEDVRDIQFALSARTIVDDQLSFDYGIRLRKDNTSFYKKMKDLMAGAAILDVDPFLEIAGGIGTEDMRNIYNNLRNPDRRINKGNKFGYNYDISASRQQAFGAMELSKESYSISAGLELGKTTMRRDGKFEKEIYPGAQSYGKSKKAEFDTYAVNVSGSYYFSPKQNLTLALYSAAEAPDYKSLFISPQSTNLLSSSADTHNIFSVEGAYQLTLDKLMLRASVYFTSVKDYSQIVYYYDDIYRRSHPGGNAYSDMLMSGIDMAYSGVEAAASYNLSRRFALSAMAAYSKNQYTSDPQVSIMTDDTKDMYVTDSRTYLDGFNVGGSPEILGSIELEYNARGWIASLSYNYMGRRYVSPSPLRRMQRAFGYAPTPAALNSFTHQEKLGDASVVNLFLLKSFNISGTWLTATLSVNNLLGSKDIIYSGYEQNRVRNYGTDNDPNFKPFDSKYLYSYPRSFYLGISYRF